MSSGARDAVITVVVALVLALIAMACVVAGAQASVSPSKQAMMDARGWTETDTLTSTPLVTEQSGDRHCERGRIKSAIRDYDGSAMVQGWTSIGVCVTQNGQLRLLGVGYGQGSSGDHWHRFLPLGYPWQQHGWKDRPTEYRSIAKYGWRFGSNDANKWYLNETLIAIKRSATNIVFVRKARWS